MSNITIELTPTELTNVLLGLDSLRANMLKGKHPVSDVNKLEAKLAAMLLPDFGPKLTCKDGSDSHLMTSPGDDGLLTCVNCGIRTTEDNVYVDHAGVIFPDFD